MLSELNVLYLDRAMELAAPGGIRPDTGRKIDWHEDAGESAFLERDLEMIEARIYDYKLRELKFRRLFPVSNEGQGSETIAYDIVRGSGVARVIANGADDLPRADTFVDRFYAVVRPIGISFAYTTQELRNAAFSNRPLEASRGAAARRGMEEKLSDIAWNGDSEYGLIGILGNANIPQSQAAAPATGSDRTWAGGDKTPLEIISDITTAFSDIVSTTNQVHKANALALPVANFEYIKKTPYSDKVPMSILRYITDPENKFEIDVIEQAPELVGSGPGGEDQMLVYEKSDEVLQFRIPMELRALPPEQRNLEFLINMEAECAGMVVRYPLACSFTYGI